MNNFDFLKPVDKNLYEIISDAEKLYRDEYFEQCIIQTRRFGEVVCKNVLGDSRTCEKTFDDMLATLKDKVSTVIQEKEFVDDLFFLKREGNSSVHGTDVKKDGIVALECLQRAFEIAINYSVHFKKAESKILKLRYDTELLVTGKKARKTLSERYVAQKEIQKNKEKKELKRAKNKKNNSKKVTSIPKKKNSFFWIFVGFTAIISTILVLTIFLLSFVS